MGRFHRHPDGTTHGHGHRHEHDHDHEPGVRDAVLRDVGDHSGYPGTGVSRIEVLEDILSENHRVAEANEKDFAEAGLLGQTSLTPHR